MLPAHSYIFLQGSHALSGQCCAPLPINQAHSVFICTFASSASSKEHSSCQKQRHILPFLHTMTQLHALFYDKLLYKDCCTQNILFSCETHPYRWQRPTATRPAGFEPATLGLGPQCSFRAELRAHAPVTHRVILKISVTRNYSSK